MWRRTIGSGKSRSIPLFRVGIVVLCLLVAVLAVDGRLQSIVRAYGQSQAERLASLAVDQAVTQVLASGEYAYNDLVVVTTDQEGNIVSLEADIVEVNRLKAAVSTAILEKLAQRENQDVRVPLGDLIGGDYFTGRGPRLTFRLSMTGTALTNLTSSFTSAGINQTRHEILLDVQMNLSVVLSDRVQTIPLHTEFLVAETILKGEVPSVYGSGWGLLGAGAETSEE